MKNKLIYILIFMLLLMPIKIYAAEITNTEIIGETEKNIGEEFSLNFKINLSGIEKNINKTLGIWLASFELIFDDETLVISDISSNDFDSYIYKENDKYYILSEVIENTNSDNICHNGILYCGNYEVSIKFYIKNTELSETIIKMGEVEIGLLDIVDSNKTYTMDDLITLNNSSSTTHTIKIKQSEIEIKNEPTNITINEKPEIDEFKKTTEQENTKSSNAFIKELKIDDYDIEFEKNKTNYIINLKEDINVLDIDVTLENENSTYRIIGADDLKNNNNEVAIIVTAEDNTTITYTINVKYEQLSQENNSEPTTFNFKELINKYMTKENLTYASIALGVIIIIILIIILINKRQNKKINNLLREL